MLARLIILWILTLTSQAVVAQQVFESPVKSVLVSVHPLALLVKSAWPQLQVDSLMSASQSPHDFSLKPSDRRKLQSAQAIIWLGPSFEPYMDKLVRGMPSVDLSQVGQSTQSRHQDVHGHHDSGRNDSSYDDRNHDDRIHEDRIHEDPHLWLQPDTIELQLALIAKQLSLPRPTQFLQQFDQWRRQAQQLLEPLQHRGFISYHDAFVDWVAYFGLKQLLVVTQSPEKPVGTRHLLNVRRVLESGQAHCLFVEPQFESKVLRKLKQGLSVPLVLIDPMASNHQVNSANFMVFYQDLLASFAQCLQGK